MKSLPLLILLICIVRVLSGQQLITDEGIQLKPGIYRDFCEFKYNRPSIKFDYVITPPGPPNYSYAINIEKPLAKAIGTIYGYCDGRDVYLSYSKSPDSPGVYGKVSYLGRYCIYWFTVMRSWYVKVSDYNYMPIPLGTSDRAAIVDMNTGQKYGLTKKLVEYLIEDDPEIYKHFSEDKKNSENFEAYLVEYLNKHKLEIKINEDDLTFGDINEMLLYENSDLSPVDYCNQIIERISGCKAITEIEISESNHPNGQCKHIGLRARHSYRYNPDYFYKIGTWRYYDDDGTLKKEIRYDLLGHDPSDYEDLIIHY
jgi:hypothetical protein